MNAFNQEEYIQYSDKKVKTEKKHLALYFTGTITLYVLLFFFVLFFVWYTAFITTHKFYGVKGVSMMPTLNNQITQEQIDYDPNVKELSYDAVYVDKFKTPKVFDIIVIEKTNDDSIIKRLMATEGDYVTIAKGQTEDGQDCFYFYRIPKTADLTAFTDEQARVDEMSGEHDYQIRGYDDWWDNRKYAPKSIEVEIGTQNFSNEYEYNFYYTFLEDYADGAYDQENNPYFVSNSGLVYVQVPEDKIFYLGDNRAHSTDSREVGFCDTKYIVGRAEFTVHDYNFVNRIVEVIRFYFAEMEKFFAR